MGIKAIVNVTYGQVCFIAYEEAFQENSSKNRTITICVYHKSNHKDFEYVGCVSIADEDINILENESGNKFAQNELITMLVSQFTLKMLFWTKTIKRENIFPAKNITIQIEEMAWQSSNPYAFSKAIRCAIKNSFNDINFLRELPKGNEIIF